MDRPQGKSTTSINLLHIFCLIIIFLTLKQINLNAVNPAILEFLSILSLTAKSFTILLCLLSFSIYSFYEVYWKRRFLPPGPVPWLVAGNMPQGGGFSKYFKNFLVLLHGASNIDLLLQKWNKYYGGIFTFWMGPIPVGVFVIFSLQSTLYKFERGCSPELTS
ncbi:unnamed protein product [Meloidogyne enterolobii]|uniref:Uncharacterized protein n=1 Tax=Meloidogyne enterolobii TaxID=390850 RepID=A0ACB1A2P3_MELEN